MLLVSQVMKSNITPVLAEQTVGEVVLILQDTGLPGLPVVDQQGKVQGMVWQNKDLFAYSPEISVGK